jgi:heat shock protein HslJ
MIKKILIALVNLLLLAGCAELPAETRDISAQIEGHEWKLVGFGESSMAVSGKATLLLKNGHYSGWSGCNAMRGTYVLKQDRLSFDTATPYRSGISTMMACANMELETRYHENMRKVHRYKIEGDQLILLDRDQHRLLILHRL